MIFTRRRRPWAPYAATALVASVLATACGTTPKAAAPPLHYKGSTLPTKAGRVHLTQPPFTGPGLALYRAASRYFRWPVLVPAPVASLRGPLSAQVSRFFAGTFTIDAKGKVGLVAGSVVAHTPVAPAAYQLRIAYLLKHRPVTLFEAVHAYAAPRGARSVALPGGLTGGRTWLGAAGPGAPDTRYVEGSVGGLFLMVYGPASGLGAGRLSGLFAHLKQVAPASGPPRAPKS